MTKIIALIFIVTLTVSCSKKFTPDYSIDIELSSPLLLKKLAGRKVNKNEFSLPFKEALIDYNQDTNLNFFELFNDHYMKMYPSGNLNSIFNLKNEKGESLDNQPQEVIGSALLKIQKRYLIEYENILKRRLEIARFRNETSITPPSLINIKVEGTDINKIKRILNTEGYLSFWHTYKNTQIGNQIFESANKILSDKMYPGFKDSVEKNLIDTNTYFDTTPIDANVDWDKYPLNNKNNQELIAIKKAPLSAVLFPYAYSGNQWVEGPVLGYAKLSDTSEVNKLLNKNYVKAILPARDLVFMWEAKSMANTNDGEPLLMLYLIKMTLNGEPLIDGEEVLHASQQFDPITSAPMVSLQFKSAGASAWEEMTEQSAKEQTGIAICLDNKVFSAPIASSKIIGGNTQITGGSFAGENGVDEAKLLTNIMNTGSMPVPITIKSINQIKSEPK